MKGDTSTASPSMRWFAKLQLGSGARIAFFKEMAALLRTGLSAGTVVDTLYRVYSDEGKRRTDPIALMMHDWARALLDGKSLSTAAVRWLPRDRRSCSS